MKTLRWDRVLIFTILNGLLWAVLQGLIILQPNGLSIGTDFIVFLILFPSLFLFEGILLKLIQFKTLTPAITHLLTVGLTYYVGYGKIPYTELLLLSGWLIGGLFLGKLLFFLQLMQSNYEARYHSEETTDTPHA